MYILANVLKYLFIGLVIFSYGHTLYTTDLSIVAHIFLFIGFICTVICAYYNLIMLIIATLFMAIIGFIFIYLVLEDTVYFSLLRLWDNIEAFVGFGAVFMLKDIVGSKEASEERRLERIEERERREAREKEVQRIRAEKEAASEARRQEEERNKYENNMALLESQRRRERGDS